MTVDERQKIYTLLSKFFPNAKQLKDRSTLTAWGLILENYTYDDVKTAVLRYAAKNKFFPDPADITGSLLPILTEVNQDKRTSAHSSSNQTWLWELVDSWGGPCPIIHDSTGMCGLALRRSVPAGCEGCRVLAVSGSCHRRDEILQEQARCRILLQHRGEAPQSALLEEYWKSECPFCQTPCFWFEGMKMKEREA